PRQILDQERDPGRRPQGEEERGSRPEGRAPERRLVPLHGIEDGAHVVRHRGRRDARRRRISVAPLVVGDAGKLLAEDRGGLAARADAEGATSSRGPDPRRLRPPGHVHRIVTLDRKEEPMNKSFCFAAALVLAAGLTVGGIAASTALGTSQDKKKPGYQDTPQITGQKWKVHDSERPHPPVVTPGAKPGDAPSDATVLFDGKDLSKWKGPKGAEAAWKVENGYFEAVPKCGDAQTADSFGADFQLHIEWATPTEVKGE